MDIKLQKLLEEAVAKVKAMSPEELEAMLKVQRENYVKAETSWPKPRCKFVNGVKVYASYADYCNG